MALTSTSDLIEALTAQENFVGYKASDSAASTSCYTNRFYSAGSWSGGSTSGLTASGRTCDISTQGALQYQQAQSGNQLYLGAIAACKGNAGALVLVDRLWEGGGYLLNTTSTQTVNSTTLPARPDTTGDDTELWIEFPGTIGASAGALFVTYTNAAGQSGRTATYWYRGHLAGTNQAERMFMNPGDHGIQSIQSLQWNVAPGNSGATSFNLAIVRRVAALQMTGVNQRQAMGPHRTGLPHIYDNSCLMAYTQNTANTSGDMWLQLKMAEVVP